MNKCIEWKEAKNRKGYGQVRLLGTLNIVSRVVFRIFKGRIPAGLMVCHRCDNPACYNPEHLFLGTNFDNQRDSVAKKRHASTKKKKCKLGHPLSGRNLYLRKDGSRECKICRRGNTLLWRLRNRGV